MLWQGRRRVGCNSTVACPISGKRCKGLDAWIIPDNNDNRLSNAFGERLDKARHEAFPLGPPAILQKSQPLPLPPRLNPGSLPSCTQPVVAL